MQLLDLPLWADATLIPLAAYSNFRPNCTEMGPVVVGYFEPPWTWTAR